MTLKVTGSNSGMRIESGATDYPSRNTENSKKMLPKNDWRSLVTEEESKSIHDWQLKPKEGSLYIQAKHNDLDLLVIGRMAALSEKELTNLGVSSENSAGSILRTNKWSINNNDIWLIGGIHGLHQFHLAADKIDPELLKSDNPTFKINVTCREILGLAAAGYEPVLTNMENKAGIVFVCKDKNKAIHMSPQSYEEIIQRALDNKILETDSDFFKKLVHMIH